MEGDKISSESFFKTYGDCYISGMSSETLRPIPSNGTDCLNRPITGFIYGGDLHGIVSIKVLSSSKRSQIEST